MRNEHDDDLAPKAEKRADFETEGFSELDDIIKDEDPDVPGADDFVDDNDTVSK